MKQTKYNSASLLAKLFTKVSASWSGTCSGLLSGASFTCWFAAYSICAFSNSSLDASYTNQSKTNQNEPPLPLSPMDPWIELRCSDYRVNRFLLEPTLRTDSPSACWSPKTRHILVRGLEWNSDLSKQSKPCPASLKPTLESETKTGTSPIETIILISEAATSSLHAMNINFRCWCLICTTCYMKYTNRGYIAINMSSLLISSTDFLCFTAADQYYVNNSLWQLFGISLQFLCFCIETLGLHIQLNNRICS